MRISSLAPPGAMGLRDNRHRPGPADRRLLNARQAAESDAAVVRAPSGLSLAESSLTALRKGWRPASVLVSLRGISARRWLPCRVRACGPGSGRTSTPWHKSAGPLPRHIRQSRRPRRRRRRAIRALRGRAAKGITYRHNRADRTRHQSENKGSIRFAAGRPHEAREKQSPPDGGTGGSRDRGRHHPSDSHDPGGQRKPQTPLAAPAVAIRASTRRVQPSGRSRPPRGGP